MFCKFLELLNDSRHKVTDVFDDLECCKSTAFANTYHSFVLDISLCACTCI